MAMCFINTTGAVWQSWTSGTTATNCQTASTVWTSWTTNSTDARSTDDWQPCQYTPAPAPTPDELAAQERDAAAEEAAWAKAERRAEKLLLAHLSREQRREYRRDRAFHVVGS